MQYLTCQAGDVSAERIVASALPPARHLLYGPAAGLYKPLRSLHVSLSLLRQNAKLARPHAVP